MSFSFSSVTLLSHHSSLHFNQVANLQVRYEDLAQTQAADEEVHQKHLTGLQDGMVATNQLHQTDLALRAVTSDLVQSGLQQALSSTRSQVKATSSQAQTITAGINALSTRNGELARLADLQQSVDRQAEISPPITTSSLPPLPSIITPSESSPAPEAVPSQPDANRPPTRPPRSGFAQALNGIIRTSARASTFRRGTQVTQGETWEEVCSLYLA